MEQIKPVLSERPVEQKEVLASQSPVVKKLPKDNNAKVKLIATLLIVVLAGVGTGWVLSGASARDSALEPISNIPETGEETRVDESVFPDSARGTLYKGGIEGEGTHYLDTGAGAEKYVYLLSTVLDLDSFVGKKVEVQGQTLAAEHAGWLMDVGRVKALE